MHDTAAATGRTEIGMQFPSREPRPLGVGGVPARMVTHTFDVKALLETTWLGALASGDARPNVLIQCAPSEVAALTERLRAWATQPFLVCRVTSEPLRLPAHGGGTLLVHDVATLTVGQQIDLYDWITAHAGRTQVIGITSVPLAPLVEGGQFLQALFRRLNVLQARATV